MKYLTQKRAERVAGKDAADLLDFSLSLTISYIDAS